MRKSPNKTSRDKGVGGLAGEKRYDQSDFQINRNLLFGYVVGKHAWLLSKLDCKVNVVCTSILDQNRKERKSKNKITASLPKAELIYSSLIPQSHPALVHIHQAVAEHMMYDTSTAL